jgi:hypothetical protein
MTYNTIIFLHVHVILFQLHTDFTTKKKSFSLQLTPSLNIKKTFLYIYEACAGGGGGGGTW